MRALIPPDFDISISEGVMWMLMNPQANKEHALHLLCEQLDVPLEQTAAFGDDLIDINMMSESGRGVLAVADANPKVLSIARRNLPVQQRGRRRPNGLKRSWAERVETREHAKIELVLNRGYALNRCSKRKKLNSRLEA